MAARVSPEEVKAIITTRFDVEPMIETAHVLVDTHLGGAGLSDDLLKQIELWLAAHLVAVADPRVTQKDVDGLKISYETRQGDVGGVGLDATRYGQQVRVLDPTGRLSQLMNPDRRPWRFRAGSPPSRAY